MGRWAGWCIHKNGFRQAIGSAATNALKIIPVVGNLLRAFQFDEPNKLVKHFGRLHHIVAGQPRVFTDAEQFNVRIFVSNRLRVGEKEK